MNSDYDHQTLMLGDMTCQQLLGMRLRTPSVPGNNGSEPVTAWTLVRRLPS